MKQAFLAVADDQNRQPTAQPTKGQANLFGCLVAILLIGALFVSNFGGLPGSGPVPAAAVRCGGLLRG